MLFSRDSCVASYYGLTRIVNRPFLFFLRLVSFQECQNLIEENRRLVNLAANSGYAINGVMNGGSSSNNGGPGSGSSSLTTLGLGLAGGGATGNGAGNGGAGMYSNVESVILQTQVETLQWQLKQV